MARADDLPLVLPVLGAGELPRGAHVQLRLSAIDDISLDISGQLLHVLEADAPSTTHEAELLEEDEDDTAAGPIALAMDVNEAQPVEGDAA
jgi:exoribonuclease-2